MVKNNKQMQIDATKGRGTTDHYIGRTMNIIKEIEYLLSGWQAARQERAEDGHTKVAIEYKGIIRGLTAALRIIEQPSNTQMHMDEDPCACNQDRDEMIKEGFSFCHWCGRGLHR